MKSKFLQVRYAGVLLFVLLLGYTIPKFLMGNGVAQISSTPEEKYYAEKVLEYRKKYLKEHGFTEPLLLRVTGKREVMQNPNSSAVHDIPYHCAEIPEGYFNQNYEKVYKYVFETTGYTWFGLKSSGSDIVMGCALYTIGA